MTSAELSEYLKSHLLRGVREEFGKIEENVAELLEVFEGHYLPLGEAGALPRSSEEALRMLKKVTGKLKLTVSETGVVREGLEALAKYPRWHEGRTISA